MATWFSRAVPLVVALSAFACGGSNGDDGQPDGSSPPAATPDAGPGKDGGTFLSDATTPSSDDAAAGDASGDAALDAAPLPPLPDLAKYVDPLIGTGASNAQNAVGGGAGGSVFPGAAVPFGMVQWSPDTPTGEPSGYGYQDKAITGFSLTHYSGAGCANNGDIPILPVRDPVAPSFAFTHANEHAAAGYYDVTSNDGVRAEITATARTGVARFTFPAGGGALIVDTTRTQSITTTTGDLRAVGSNGIAGLTTGGHFCGAANSYTVFFVAQFDHPWTKIDATGGKAVVTFDPAAGPVVMKVGISYVGESNAQANLDAESPGFDFDGAHTRATRAWNEKLAAVQVTGGSPGDTTKLYTALYHSFLAPTVYSDVNGQYRGFDKVVRTVDAGRVQYANYSGWDIYRSQIQLLALLFPDVASDMAQSLVVDAQQCGAFPKWSQNNDEANIMVGDPGSIIVASAYAFGATKFDTKSALATMLNMGLVNGVQCNGQTELYGLDQYMSYGYLSDGEWGGASTTLEYASRDFAVAQFAKALGDDASARILMGRTASWQNEINPNGLLEMRTSGGGWKTPLDGPGDGSNAEYVEGNAEQYTWMVPYDPRTLFDTLGGDSKVVPRLDTFFTKLNAGLKDPNFYMGNEPNFATPWLYDWAHAPWRTQDVVRRIVDETFTTAPGGLPGNDDLGAMSSWLVFAQLGLYPELPGVGGFVVATPVFPGAVVRLGNGKTLTINVAGAPGRYIQSATIDGAPTTSLWVPLSSLVNGATLAYVAGTTQSTWGSGAADAPPSFGPGEYGAMDDALDALGIRADGTASPSDFDGVGYSYSAQALAAGGVNGTVVHGGVTFGWPSGAAGVDHVIASGQTLRFTTTQVGGHLAWLGSASDGPSSGTGTLHYTDGTSAPFTLAFSDWTLNGGGAAVQSGNEIAVTCDYRNAGPQKDAVKTYVFYSSVALDGARTLASVTLPAMVSAGRLHVFSVALAP